MSFLGPIMNIFLYGVCIAIIYIGGLKINDNISFILAGNENVFMVGDVMEAITYVSMILGAVMQLSMISQQVTRATVSALRVREVLDSIPVITSTNTEVVKTEEAGTIEFKNVSFSYPNFSSDDILNNVSLKINTGETLAILGATGSGKTTLVNLIPRFYDTSKGDVCLGKTLSKSYHQSHPFIVRKNKKRSYEGNTRFLQYFFYFKTGPPNICFVKIKLCLLMLVCLKLNLHNRIAVCLNSFLQLSFFVLKLLYSFIQIIVLSIVQIIHFNLLLTI